MMPRASLMAALLALATCASAFGQYGSANPFKQEPSFLTCPTPTTCPSGYTGSVCEFPMCTQRGVVLPPEYDGSFHIDMQYLSSCSGALQIPVDSHVGSLILVVNGFDMSLMPNATVYNPQGTVVQNIEITSSGQTWTAAINSINRASAYGVYSILITSVSGGPCLYESRAQTSMTLSLGYVSGSGYQNNDFPLPALPENTVGGIVAHVNGLNRPGFSSVINVFSSPGNVSQLVAAYPVIERFNCANDIFVGPVICTTDSQYMFQLVGIDEQGYQFMRTNYLTCNSSLAFTSTASPLSTTTSQCLNGGYYNTNTQSCECGFYYTGAICQQPICFNGGTQVQNGCVCPPGYGDANCLEAMCMTPNTNIPPFSAYGRTITLIIQNTASMNATINTIADYASEMYYDFQLQYPGYVLNWVVITFNDQQGVQQVANTADPNVLFQALWHIGDSQVQSSACYQPFVAAVTKGLSPEGAQPAQYSDVYVFTDSPPDVTNSAANLGLYDLIESTKNSLFIYIEAPSNGFCVQYNATDPNNVFNYYYNYAQFSGGLALLQSTGPRQIQQLSMIPTSYMRQQTFQRSFADCTNSSGIDVFIPVDSHTGSVQITVQGNSPGLDAYRPDGSRFSTVPLLDNYYSAVRQVISPCPPDWTQIDNKCFSGQFVSTDWYTANINCAGLGGSLMTILNPEKQGLADRQTGQIDYWIALENLNGTSPPAWNWNTNTGTNIPLGDHYKNWAPNNPSPTGGNCVMVRHNGSPNGQWYNVPCNQTVNYVCEMHTFAFESPDFPPGVWRINLNTQRQTSTSPVQGAYGNNCLVTVNVQSDMQLFYGYNSGPDSITNDMPMAEPNGTSSYNRFVANFTHLDESLAMVNMVEFYDLNYNLLSAQWMTHRQSPCAYRYVSDVFTCPANSFATVVTGIDDRGFTFNRYDWGICLGMSSG